jgi:twitching motility protein PilT
LLGSPPMVDAHEHELGLLGRLAVQLEMISIEQLRHALFRQVEEAHARPLGAILVELGFISEKELAHLLQAQSEFAASPRRRHREPLVGVHEFLRGGDVTPVEEVDPRLLELVYGAWDQYASDLHVHAGAVPFVRIDGEVTPLNLPAPSVGEVSRMLRSFLPEPAWQELLDQGDVDLAWQPHETVRCRVNAFISSNGPGVAMRILSAAPPSLQDLGLPGIVARSVAFHQGLVLITGPSGCGKTSTCAALLRLINEERADNIITIEDPIEYVHEPDRSAILQREVGGHTESFPAALRGALRQDPDVLLVGELRDLESVQLAISAAETGHLVLATMHTHSVAGTIDRLVGSFPAEQQSQVRAMFSESLRAIVSQRLVRRIDGPGRVAACEVVFNNPSVANLIRENRTFQLANIIALSRSQGMQRMEDSLRELVDAGVISPAELSHGAAG